MYDNNIYLIIPQGSGKATGLWTKSTVSYSTFKIQNVEEYKKKYVSYMNDVIVNCYHGYCQGLRFLPSGSHREHGLLAELVDI